MCCYSCLVSFCIAADCFLDRWDFQVPPYVLVSDIPGAFTIVLRILACIISILFIWLIDAVPHSGIPYVQIGFMIVLYIFNLFSMLNLDFRLVNQCICLLVSM